MAFKPVQTLSVNCPLQLSWKRCTCQLVREHSILSRPPCHTQYIFKYESDFMLNVCCNNRTWSPLISRFHKKIETLLELTSSACICSLVFSLVSRITFSSSLCRSSMACCWRKQKISEPGQRACLSATISECCRLTCSCPPQWPTGSQEMFDCKENARTHLHFDPRD